MVRVHVRWCTTVVNRFISTSKTYRFKRNQLFVENVFTRPNNNCYFNGNVYEPVTKLSKADSALNPCLTACFCDQRTYDK